MARACGQKFETELKSPAPSFPIPLASSRSNLTQVKFLFDTAETFFGARPASSSTPLECLTLNTHPLSTFLLDHHCRPSWTIFYAKVWDVVLHHVESQSPEIEEGQKKERAILYISIFSIQTHVSYYHWWVFLIF